MTDANDAELAVLNSLDDTELERIEQGEPLGVRPGGRLRQVLAHQHPIHDEIRKVYDNIGGTKGFTDWAEKPENQTAFYKMFARVAPQPKEATFVQISNILNPEEPSSGETFEAEKLKDVTGQQAAAIYEVIVKGNAT